MAITVKFIADIANWMSGLGKSEEALEDNADGLEDLMRHAVKLGTQAGRTADQIAQDFTEAFGIPLERAKKAVDEVIDSTDELGDAGDTAGREMGDGIGAGADTAGQHLTEMGSIARDVLAGDFTGAAQTAVDAVADIAGELPGVGLAASAVAGIVGTVLVNAFMAAQERQEAITEASKEWADAFMESGQRVLTASQQVAMGQDIYNTRLDEAKKNSENWGVSLETAVAAMTGSQSAIDEVTGSLEDMTAAQEENGYELGENRRGTEDGTRALEDLQAAMEAGSATADSWSYFLRDVASSAEGATTNVDEFGDSVVTLPGGKQIYIDAETGQATMDVNAIEGKIYGIPDGSSTVRVNVDASKWDGWSPGVKWATVRVNTVPTGTGTVLRQGP